MTTKQGHTSSGKYMYTSAPGGQYGTMRCANCGKQITEGQYRVQEKPDRYVTWHRACCRDDQQWSVIDEQAANHKAHQVLLLEAARSFRERWGVADLDDLIDDLEANFPSRGAQ